MMEQSVIYKYIDLQKNIMYWEMKAENKVINVLFLFPYLFDTNYNRFDVMNAKIIWYWKFIEKKKLTEHFWCYL